MKYEYGLKHRLFKRSLNNDPLAPVAKFEFQRDFTGTYFHFNDDTNG